MKASRLFAMAVLLAGLCTSSPALADNEAAQRTERRTPVVVEFEGNDSIGASLFADLQKKISATNPQKPAREAKFRLLLSTSSEFPSRPGVGSVYAVVWVLALSEGSMEYYLVRDLGIVTPDSINEVADRIISRTDGVAARYGYLDREK